MKASVPRGDELVAELNSLTSAKLPDQLGVLGVRRVRDGVDLSHHVCWHATLAHGCHALESAKVLDEHDPWHNGARDPDRPAVVDEAAEESGLEEHLCDDDIGTSVALLFQVSELFLVTKKRRRWLLAAV
jgi:hypothetical protein